MSALVEFNIHICIGIVTTSINLFTKHHSESYARHSSECPRKDASALGVPTTLIHFPMCLNKPSTERLRVTSGSTDHYFIQLLDVFDDCFYTLYSHTSIISVNTFGIMSELTGTVRTILEWLKRWDEDILPFHKSECHEMLVKHIDLMLRGRKGIRIFFPLCGKALDMKWLYDEGHIIIGLEASAKGIEDFFTEHGLKFTTESVADGKMKLYKTDDNRMLMYCGDIYDFNSSIGGKMEGIWDRGSFVAINREDREKYSKILIDLMAKDCHYLLDTFQFDSSEYAGPPHPVPYEEVNRFYGEKCKIEQVEEKDSMTEKQKGWGLKTFRETVLELTLK